MWKPSVCLILSFLISPFQVFAADTAKLDLATFLSRVKEANLQLKAEGAKASAARQNARGIRVPVPMVGYMSSTDQSGAKAGGLEISAAVPFPTKIENDHTAREFDARSQEEMKLASEDEILADAKAAYIRLWVSQQKLEALRNKKQVIDEHIRLSQAVTRSDSSLRIHTLKAENDSDLTENEILALEQDVQEKKSAVANFLNADLSKFNASLMEPELSALPRQDAGVSHQLEAARLSFEAFKARESEAKGEWFPDLFLRYRKSDGTQMMPGFSETMVAISVPFLLPWQPSSASQKASAQTAQADFEYQNRKQQIETAREVLLERAESLKKQLDAINGKLLPRAEKRMHLLHNLAPRDMETLQDHREIMEAFPELRMKALDLRVQYEEAVAEYSKYGQNETRSMRSLR